MLRTFAATLLTLMLTTAIARGDEPDPRAVLDQAIGAARAVKTVRYEAKSMPRGPMSARQPRVEGTVTLGSNPGKLWPRVLLDAKLQPPGRTNSQHALVASDGDNVTLIEHSARSYTKWAMPEGARVLGVVLPVLVRELTDDEPYKRERTGTLEYGGTETVGGETCDIIKVVYAKADEKGRWYFARKDHLPRRVVRIVQHQGQESTVTTDIEKIATNVEVKPDTWRPTAPDGFVSLGPRGLLAVGSPAPAFKMKDGEGKEVTLASLRGKLVFIDFWSTWCGPCRRAMPGMQKLHEKYKDNPAVAVYGVNCRERNPNADPVGFMKQNKFTYPILLDGNAAAGAYRVRGIPAFYLIGADGKVLLAWSGFSEAHEEHAAKTIEEELKKLETATASTGSDSAPRGS